MIFVKTTLEIPDALFRKIKATAAGDGKTLKQFVTEAVQEKLTRPAGSKKAYGWRATLGQLSVADKKAARKVDAIINTPGFRSVDAEDWQ
jgi:hypothetical protein